MAGTLPSEIIAGISFIGHAGGAVKSLGGFRKSHHTLPDTANAVTNAFLAKICVAELEEESEALFQRVRTGLAYKRTDVSLELSSPVAVLTAKDFTVEITYALEAGDPARYTTTHTLHSLRDGDLAQTEKFGAVFASMFSEISFILKKGARVEAMIDAIEALNGDGGLAVNYPADCRECVISVTGVDAEVHCTGMTLDLVFPRTGSPRELIAAFAAVRDAFGLSRDLSRMIG